MHVIAQVTDIHLSVGNSDIVAQNDARLHMVLEALMKARPTPNAIFFTGDLVDRGLVSEYEKLRCIIGDLEKIPLYFGLGNHDRRSAFYEVFGDLAPRHRSGFLQYATDVGDLQVIMCDTLQEGLHGGSFCEKRRKWLADLLDGSADKPVLIFMHHPPCISGIPWMDPTPDAQWMRSLERALLNRPQIMGLAAGHLHRPLSARFAGHQLVVAPAVCNQLTLNFSSVDLTRPDGREMLVKEPPGYLLHVWKNGTLVSHNAVAGDFAPAVHLTQRWGSASA